MHHRQQSPFFRFGALALLGAAPMLGILIVLLHGCTANPVRASQNTAQTAYALYGEFVIFEQQAAQLRAQLPKNEFVVIQQADNIAKPTVDALLQAVRDYENAQTALQHNTGNAAKLATVTQNLQKWVAQANTDINHLVQAIRGAQHP